MQARVPQVMLFYGARALGLLIKPASLWLALRSGDAQTSTQLATYYFLTAATFIALNSEAHIQYYKSRFGGPDAVDTLSRCLLLRRYLHDLSMHIIVFLPVLWIAFIAYFGAAAPALAFAIFVLLEKLWDELQRDLIFSRRYAEWSAWFIVKMAAPVLALGVSVQTGWNLFVCLLAISCVVACITAYRLVPAVVRRLLLGAARSALHASWMRYWQVYRSRFVLGQLIALASVNVVNIDKWLAPFFFGPRLLVELVLLSQFGAAYLVLIDNVFFSRGRDQYVKAKQSVAQITNWRLLFLVSAGYLLSVGFAVGQFGPSLGIEAISTLQVTIALLSYVALGITRPLVEHAFWHLPRVWSAVLDYSAILLAATLGYAAARAGELTLLLLASSLAISVRSVAYWIVCRSALMRQGARVGVGS